MSTVFSSIRLGFFFTFWRLVIPSCVSFSVYHALSCTCTDNTHEFTGPCRLQIFTGSCRSQHVCRSQASPPLFFTYPASMLFLEAESSAMPILSLCFTHYSEQCWFSMAVLVLTISLVIVYSVLILHIIGPLFPDNCKTPQNIVISQWINRTCAAAARKQKKTPHRFSADYQQILSEFANVLDLDFVNFCLENTGFDNCSVCVQ